MSSDYISRDYLLDRVDEIVQTNHLRLDYMWFTPNGVKTLAKEAPAADVAPVRHGRWIPAQDYSDGNEDIECSSCGEWFKSLELCGRLGEPNYCPVCGSKNKDGGKDRV